METPPPLPPIERPDHITPQVLYLRKILLTLVIVLIAPLWLFNEIENWNHPPQHHQEDQAFLLAAESYSELQLSQTANQNTHSPLILELLDTDTFANTLNQEIALHQAFFQQNVITEPSSLATLPTLHLLAGNNQQALNLTKIKNQPYAEIITALAQSKPLSDQQIREIQNLQPEYTNFPAPKIWLQLNENLTTGSTQPLIPPAPNKLTARVTNTVIGIIALIIAFVLILKLKPKSLTFPAPDFSLDCITAIAIFIAAEWLANILYELPFLFVPSTATDTDIYYILADSIFRIVPAVIALTYISYKTPIKNLFQNANHALLATCASIGITIPLYSTLHYLLAPFLREDFATSNTALFYDTHALLSEILSSVILAPICEEIIFRGLLLTALANKLGTKAAVILSSAIFSLIHYYDFVNTIDVFIFGIIMAITFLKTRSLVPCIIAHALFNLWITADTWLIYIQP